MRQEPNIILKRNKLKLLIKEVKLFSKENKLVFNKIIDKLQSEENLSIDSLEVDSQLIDKIFKFASIKNILQNKIHENDKKIELQ